MSKQNKSEISYLNTQGVTKIIPRNGGNGYTIIPIDSYEQAHKYSEYTSWCVTRDQYEFDCYTQGGNRFYFCLEDGFENIPKNDNFVPLNTYDLSMLSVEIDMNGNLLRITTRYNHDFGGENNDGLCSVAQLEDILDVNFYKVFLPYTREELHERGIILFDEVQGLLDSGKKPEEIFDRIFIIYNGYLRVILNNKWNWISMDNRLVSPKQWYDYIGDFENGYAIVKLNNKYNFIDTNFKYISEQWYDWCLDFENGYAIVNLNDKYNFIDTNGKYITDQWYDEFHLYHEGYSIRLNNKWYFIDKNRNIGNIINPPNKWYNTTVEDLNIVFQQAYK